MVIHVIRRPARQKAATVAPAPESEVVPVAARLTRGWDDRDLRGEVVGWRREHAFATFIDRAKELGIR